MARPSGARRRDRSVCRAKGAPGPDRGVYVIAACGPLPGAGRIPAAGPDHGKVIHTGGCHRPGAGLRSIMAWCSAALATVTGGAALFFKFRQNSHVNKSES